MTWRQIPAYLDDRFQEFLDCWVLLLRSNIIHRHLQYVLGRYIGLSISLRCSASGITSITIDGQERST